jgi:hypothetical protein
VPDHSSLSRIRDRYGEEIFERVFRRIVELCKEKSLVAQACRVMTDATLIAANAALNSLVHNDPKEADKEMVNRCDFRSPRPRSGSSPRSGRARQSAAENLVSA